MTEGKSVIIAQWSAFRGGNCSIQRTTTTVPLLICNIDMIQLIIFYQFLSFCICL